MEKFAYDRWEAWRDYPQNRVDLAVSRLKDINNNMFVVNSWLESVGLGCGYLDKTTQIEQLEKMYQTFTAYEMWFPGEVEGLETQLYKSYVNGATEAISKISLDDIKTENHLGIVEVTARGVSAYPKDYLTFKDFMGTSLSDAITTTNPDYCVSDYAEMFAKQYEKYKEENPEEQYELNEYLKELYTQGKFDHDVDKPFLSFLDEALSITIIVPIIEACTGEELLTRNKLTDLERGLRAVCAVVDIVSLGATATTSKMTISSIGKLMLAETGSNLVATTTGYIGSELGLPMPLVLALSTMGGSIAGIQLANTHFCKGPISGNGRVDDFLEVKHLEASGGPISSFADWMSPNDAERYLKFLETGSTAGLTEVEIIAIRKVDELLVLERVNYQDILKIRNMNRVLESGSKTPSEIAKSWQGSGKYPGIDDYTDVTVNKGTILYRGEPNGTEYFTTLDAIEQSGRDATTLFEGLQVEKNPIHGYRGEMQGYLFNEDIASAYGITSANPQFGKGGLPQYFVPNVQELINKGILMPVDNIKLYK